MSTPGSGGPSGPPPGAPPPPPPPNSNETSAPSKTKTNSSDEGWKKVQGKKKDRLVARIPKDKSQYPGFPNQMVDETDKDYDSRVIEFWRTHRNAKLRKSAKRKSSTEASAQANAAATPGPSGSKSSGPGASKKVDNKVTPAKPVSSYKKATMLNLPHGIQQVFVFAGKDKPVAISVQDWQEVIQRVQAEWGRQVDEGLEDVNDLEIVKIQWKSGKGIIECGTTWSVSWVKHVINKLVLRSKINGIEELKYFKAYAKAELDQMTFANVFLDNRFQMVSPMTTLKGALAKINLSGNMTGVSVVKTFEARVNGKSKGRVVRLVMNNDLAKGIKDHQEKYECIRAGFGYIKFDFPKEEDSAMEEAKRLAAINIEEQPSSEVEMTEEEPKTS